MNIAGPRTRRKAPPPPPSARPLPSYTTATTTTTGRTKPFFTFSKSATPTYQPSTPSTSTPHTLSSIPAPASSDAWTWRSAVPSALWAATRYTASTLSSALGWACRAERRALAPTLKPGHNDSWYHPTTLLSSLFDTKDTRFTAFSSWAGGGSGGTKDGKRWTEKRSENQRAEGEAFGGSRTAKRNREKTLERLRREALAESTGAGTGKRKAKVKW